MLASGHDNSYCTLYDLRQGRLLQAWRPHTDEVRSARFNADATYFLSGSYDTTVKLMDMQGKFCWFQVNALLTSGKYITYFW